MRFSRRQSGLYVPDDWTPGRIVVPASARASFGPRTYYVGGSASGVAMPTADNLVYDGSMRVPVNDLGDSTYGWNGAGRGQGQSRGLTYNPANHSLFTLGNYTDPGGPYITEVLIPDPLGQGNNLAGNSNNQASMPTATSLQTFKQLLDPAKAYGVDPFFGGSMGIGGLMLADDGFIYGTVYHNFSGGQLNNIFQRNTNLATNNFRGWFTVFDSLIHAEVGDYGACSFLAGGIGAIQSSLRASFGGADVMSGLWGASITARDSFGINAGVFKTSDVAADTGATNIAGNPPTSVASSSPSAAKTIVGYPETHETLGKWNDVDLGTDSSDYYHFSSNPYLRPYVNWNEFQGGLAFEDGGLFTITAYGRGHTLDDSSVDQVTATYGPSTQIWAKNGTKDFIFAPQNAPVALAMAVLSAANGNRVSCNAGSVRLTSDGTPFTSGMVGQVFFLSSGTHFNAGVYTVANYVSASQIDLDRDPTDGNNATLGDGGVGGDLGYAAYSPNEPERSGHSPRAWPYRFRLIGVRQSDAILAYNGTIKPWDITPYTNAEFLIPFGDPQTSICNGLAWCYVPSIRKVFILQPDVDYGGDYPMIHQFSFQQRSA